MTNNEPATKLEWLGSVVQRYEGPLTRYATRITGNLERARDVVQETFLRLCAEKPARVQRHLAEWLFTVCRNRAIDVQRKEVRMSALSDAQLETCTSRDAEPPLELERQDDMAQVLRVIETLPANQQEVIRLKFQNGFRYGEISRVTGLTVSNVGFLIHTGLKTIRQQLCRQSGLAPRA